MRFDQIPNGAWVPEQADLWAADDMLQPGVVLPGDFAIGGSVSTGSAITIAAGAVWIRGSSGTLHRHVRAAGGTIGPTVGGAQASNTSRLDSLYAVYAGPGQEPTYQYATGVQQAGAATVTYLNRSGAAGPPANSVLLVDYILANATGPTTVTRYDRRPWARGYEASSHGTANDVDYPASGPGGSGTLTDLRLRAECGGALWLETFHDISWFGSNVGDNANFQLTLDGTVIRSWQPQVRGGRQHDLFRHKFAVAAGSHLIGLNYSTTIGAAGTIQVMNESAYNAPSATVREVLPDANNGTA